MKEKYHRPAPGTIKEIDDAIEEAEDAAHIEEWEEGAHELSRSLYESHEGLRADHHERSSAQRSMSGNNKLLYRTLRKCEK